MTGPGRRVCLARIAGSHGLRGEVRIDSFTEVPEDFASYGPLTDASGAIEYKVRGLRDGTRGLIARIDGVNDRTQADLMRGTELFVLREQLPEPDEDGEYYHEDLIGLRVDRPDGTQEGTVHAVHNFGAGDLLEIARPGASSRLVPFTDEAVPVVDLAGRRVVVDYPDD